MKNQLKMKFQGDTFKKMLSGSTADDLEALKNENETENSAQDTQSVKNPLETDSIQENALRINSQLILKLSKMKMRQKTLLKIHNQLKVILLKLIAFKKMLLRINNQLILKLSKMKMRQKTLLKIRNQ